MGRYPEDFFPGLSIFIGYGDFNLLTEFLDLPVDRVFGGRGQPDLFHLKGVGAEQFPNGLFSPDPFGIGGLDDGRSYSTNAKVLGLEDGY